MVFICWHSQSKETRTVNGIFLECLFSYIYVKYNELLPIVHYVKNEKCLDMNDNKHSHQFELLLKTFSETYR